MLNQKSTQGLLIPALFTAVLITGAFAFVGRMADGNGTDSLVGSEFQIEGFQKAKIIGISNSRAIVVLTNNVGHNSFEEMSFNTVEMLKSLPQGK